jgi:flagellar protein FlaG
MSNTINTNVAPPPRPAVGTAALQRPTVEAAQPKGPESVKAEPAPRSEQARTELAQLLDELNEQSRKEGRNLNFSMDDEVNRLVITVRQTETGEVIRQIPSEAVLRLAHNLKSIRGLLYNETS